MSIKRPAVLFAALFVFSAFCAVGGAGIAAVIVSAILVMLSFAALIKKNLRVCAVLLLCAFACSYAVIFTRFTENSVNSRLKLHGDTGRFRAITRDVSVYGSKATVYAEISEGPLKGMRAVVFADGDGAAPTLYETVSFDSTLVPIIGGHEKRVYGGDKYYMAGGYFLSAKARDLRVEGLPEKSEMTWVQKYYFHIYDSFIKSMPYVGTTDTFPYAIALLTGDRTRFDTEKYNSFSRSGLTPYMCISGLHVAMATGMLGFALRKLRIGKIPAFCVTLVFLAVICAATGASGSVMRAAIMSAVLCAAGLRGKASDGYSSLAVAFIIICINNPYCIYDYGTLLSFLCMMGLICAENVNAHSSFLPVKINFVFRAPLVSSFYAFGFGSVAVSTLFDGIYLLSPFSNLAAAVVFTPLMYALVFTALISFMPIAVMKVFSVPSAFLIKAFEIISDLFGVIPGSYAAEPLPVYAVYICVGTIFVHLVLCAFGKFRHHAVSGFLCAALPIVFISVCHFVNMAFA